jgi:hypothetical protein
VGKLRKRYSVSTLLDSVISKSDRLLARPEPPDQNLTVINQITVAQAQQHTLQVDADLTQVQTQVERQPKQRNEAELAAELTAKFKALYEQEITVKERLTKCEKKYALSQQDAKKQVKWLKGLTIFLEAIILIGLIWLISFYGWNWVEPLTFIVGVIIWLVQGVIALNVYGTVSLVDGLQISEQRLEEKAYIKYGYDKAEHERLKKELEQVKQQYYAF